MEQVTYTHKAWLGFCPVYVAHHPELDFEMIERREWLGWWLDANMAIYDMMFQLARLANPDFEPAFPLSHFCKMDEPVVIEFEDEE